MSLYTVRFAELAGYTFQVRVRPACGVDPVTAAVQRLWGYDATWQPADAQDAATGRVYVRPDADAPLSIQPQRLGLARVTVHKEKTPCPTP
jgi:hypothetical protein